MSVGHRFISDSMETVPLRLCREAPISCVKDEIQFLGVREIRSVRIPIVKEKSKSRRRNGYPVKKLRKRNDAARPTGESSSQK